MIIEAILSIPRRQINLAIRFLDTNVLLKNPEQYFDSMFYISSETIRELENIKSSIVRKDESIRYAARKAVRLLTEHIGDFRVIIYDGDVRNIISSVHLEDSPDNRICASAALCMKSGEDIVFVTNDLCCRIIAQNIFELPVEWVEKKEDIYKGYKVIAGTTEDINNAMEYLDYSEWNTNEYLIIRNSDDGSEREMRYDGKEFVTLKLPPSKYIKGKNALQRCALDILFNPSITIAAILGGFGSGKTWLSTKMSIYAVQEKGWQSRIIALREIVSEGKEIGYLPGEKDSKILDFMLPFADQLEGGEFELESLKQRGVIEANTPYFIKGRTYNNSILLCDEAEDMTEKQIRLIGTRVGENSRVFFSGDYRQSVINTSENNALVTMCDRLKGNPMFACIYLEEDVRSSTSRLFADLF